MAEDGWSNHPKEEDKPPALLTHGLDADPALLSCGSEPPALACPDSTHPAETGSSIVFPGLPTGFKPTYKKDKSKSAQPGTTAQKADQDIPPLGAALDHEAASELFSGIPKGFKPVYKSQSSESKDHPTAPPSASHNLPSSLSSSSSVPLAQPSSASATSPADGGQAHQGATVVSLLGGVDPSPTRAHHDPVQAAEASAESAAFTASNPFATLVVGGRQLLKCHFPSFRKETSSRSTDVHPGGVLAVDGGFQLRFVTFTHYSCPKQHGLRARVVVHDCNGADTTVDLGLIRPRADIQTATWIGAAPPKSVQFFLQKSVSGEEDLSEAEQELVQQLEEIVREEYRKGFGTVSTFTLRCYFEDTALYNEVVVKQYGSSWHRFLANHRTRFNITGYSNQDIAAKGLHPYATPHEHRISLRSSDTNECIQQDVAKAKERVEAEAEVLAATKEMIASSPDGWVDEFTLLRRLQQTKGFDTMLVPVASCLTQLMKRNSDRFVALNTGDTAPTKYGLRTDEAGKLSRELAFHKKMEANQRSRSHQQWQSHQQQQQQHNRPTTSAPSSSGSSVIATPPPAYSTSMWSSNVRPPSPPHNSHVPESPPQRGGRERKK